MGADLLVAWAEGVDVHVGGDVVPEEVAVARAASATAADCVDHVGGGAAVAVAGGGHQALW